MDVFSVANFDHVYDESVIFNSVHDAILSLTDPISILTGEFLTPDGAGVIAELLDPLNDSLTVLLSGSGRDLLHGRGFD